MKKIELKPNGWFPFLPSVVPMALATGVLLVLTDSRPVSESWIRYTIQSTGFAISFWAFASWWVRRRRRRAHER